MSPRAKELIDYLTDSDLESSEDEYYYEEGNILDIIDGYYYLENPRKYKENQIYNINEPFLIRLTNVLLAYIQNRPTIFNVDNENRERLSMLLHALGQDSQNYSFTNFNSDCEDTILTTLCDVRVVFSGFIKNVDSSIELLLSFYDVV